MIEKKIISVRFVPAHLSWLFVTPYCLWWEITAAWCLFSDQSHTPLFDCLCVFVFADSLQSQFLIEFAPPAGAPGKERHCRRLTVSYPAKKKNKKRNTHICTRERGIVSIWVLLPLIVSLSRCLTVGQVKFDPPLRKETEPHHEPVSCPLSHVFKGLCEIKLSPPKHRRRPQRCYQAGSNQT